MSSRIRTKFVKHMEWYGLTAKTQKNYVTGVKGLSRHYAQSPETLTDDQVSSYFYYLLTVRKLEWGSCHCYLSGVKYFYKHICGREVDGSYGLPPRPRNRKLPAVLSMEEVARILSCAKNLKHRVLLKTMYSAGLRVGEAIRLKPEQIESDLSRMAIRVEQGKGRKDRYTILSAKLLPELREYWRRYPPKQWLFPGQKPGTHITAVTAWRILEAAKKKLALPKSAVRILYVIHSLHIYYTKGMTFTQSASSLATPQ